MKKTLISIYIFTVIGAWGFLLFKLPAPLPWQRDSEAPVLKFTVSDQTLSEPTFTYRQGPLRQGVSENETVPLKIRTLWESEPLNMGIHAASKASPAVDESGVYIGGDNASFSRFSLEGQLIWRFRADQAKLGIHGTALLDKEFVYFGAYNGLFYCLRKENGSVVWAARLGEAIGSSPVADGEAIYISAETELGRRSSFAARTFLYPPRNGRLYKLNRRTGEVLWRGDWVGEQIHSSPTLYDQGRKVGVGANNGFYYAYAAETGQLLWKRDVGGAVKGTAVADEKNRLYFGTYGKSFVALDGNDGNLLWTVALSGISQSSAALVPEAGILVTAAHEDGEILGLKKEDGRVLWRYPSKNKLSRSSPVVIRSGVNEPWTVWMMCEGSSLCAIRPQDGKRLQSWPLSQALTGAPTVFAGNLYLALNNGGLIKFGPVKP